MKGDRTNLDISAEDLALIEKARSSGARVITVLLSGRPLILGKALDRSDAFVVAWLPGTEGLGVTDVLFGKYQPTGKLPRNWRSNDQLTSTMNQPGPGTLQFPYGFGSKYWPSRKILLRSDHPV